MCPTDMLTLSSSVLKQDIFQTLFGQLALLPLSLV